MQCELMNLLHVLLMLFFTLMSILSLTQAFRLLGGTGPANAKKYMQENEMPYGLRRFYLVYDDQTEPLTPTVDLQKLKTMPCALNAASTEYNIQNLKSYIEKNEIPDFKTVYNHLLYTMNGYNNDIINQYSNVLDVIKQPLHLSNENMNAGIATCKIILDAVWEVVWKGSQNKDYSQTTPETKPVITHLLKILCALNQVVMQKKYISEEKMLILNHFLAETLQELLDAMASLILGVDVFRASRTAVKMVIEEIQLQKNIYFNIGYITVVMSNACDGEFGEVNDKNVAERKEEYRSAKEKIYQEIAVGVEEYISRG